MKKGTFFNIIFEKPISLYILKCVPLQSIIMINVVALVQLKAFARQDGFLLFLLWAASFAAMVTNPASSWGGALAFTTPFFVGWLLVRFRNYALDGVISFRRALAFSLYTFFYASLLFAVGQYVYFRFFDHGSFLTMLLSSIKVYETQGISLGDLRQSLTIVGQLTPIEIAFAFMMQNFLIGLVLSFPIAMFTQKRKTTPPASFNNQQ